MILKEMYSALRLRIGNPPLRDVTDEHLHDFLTRGLEWLAVELRYSVTSTSSALTLVAGTQEYTLPADLMMLLFVEHNGKSLTPRTVMEWEREGTDWRNADAGTPREYAVLGRSIIFYPKPDATAVSDDSSPLIRYYAASPGLDADSATTGTPSLGDADQMLAVYHAAFEWLGLFPERDPTGRMQQTNATLLQQLLPAAKERAEKRIADLYPSMWVETGRGGAAR